MLALLHATLGHNDNELLESQRPWVSIAGLPEEGGEILDG